MTGQYNTLDLAGVSTATSLWNPFFTFLTGIVSALTPIIGHHLGQGNKKRIASDFYQFIYLSFMMAALLIAFVLVVAPIILGKIGLESVVAGIATHYLGFLSFGILPLLLFSVVRSLLDTLGLTRLSMYLMLLLLPLDLWSLWSARARRSRSRTRNLLGLLGPPHHRFFDSFQAS